MEHLVYLAIGSNIGDRMLFLQNAIDALPPKVRPMHASSIFESQPWGFANQGKFLNMALEAQTDLSPQELLSYIKEIEHILGRTPSFKNGPREIDIDILLYGNELISENNLVIPHPGLSERAFVLYPLANLIPKNIIPPFGESVLALRMKSDGASLSLVPEMEIQIESS